MHNLHILMSTSDNKLICLEDFFRSIFEIKKYEQNCSKEYNSPTRILLANNKLS